MVNGSNLPTAMLPLRVRRALSNPRCTNHKVVYTERKDLDTNLVVRMR